MHFAAVRSNRLSIAFTFVMVLLAAQAAFADSITVFWDPNPTLLPVTTFTGVTSPAV